MNREELLKAIEDKKQFIGTMEKELEVAKADVYSQVLVGLIQETIEFHTDILNNYQNALAAIVEVAPVGRPSQGTTKKVSVTLPDYLWDWIEEMVCDNDFGSRSAFFRRLVLDSYVEINRNGNSDLKK